MLRRLAILLPLAFVAACFQGADMESLDFACVAADECGEGWVCKTSHGICVPEDDCEGGCEGIDCGDDGCGHTCGTCAEGTVCSPLGLCCQPSCGTRECGDDGCGGSCGTCEPLEACRQGTCEPMGSWTCSEVYECSELCAMGMTGNPCAAGCLDEGTEQAQESFLYYLSCLEGPCGSVMGEEDQLVFCSMQSCLDEFSSCFSGTRSCAEILVCSFGCGLDMACVDKCMRGGLPSAQDPFVDLLTCLTVSCGVDASEECMTKELNGACAVEFGICSPN